MDRPDVRSIREDQLLWKRRDHSQNEGDGLRVKGFHINVGMLVIRFPDPFDAGTWLSPSSPIQPLLAHIVGDPIGKDTLRLRSDIEKLRHAAIIQSSPAK